MLAQNIMHWFIGEGYRIKISKILHYSILSIPGLVPEIGHAGLLQLKAQYLKTMLISQVTQLCVPQVPVINAQNSYSSNHPVLKSCLLFRMIILNTMIELIFFN